MGSSIFILFLISYFSSYSLIPCFSPLFAHLLLSSAVVCPQNTTYTNVCINMRYVQSTLLGNATLVSRCVSFVRLCGKITSHCDTVTEDLVFVFLLLVRVRVGLALDEHTVWNHNTTKLQLGVFHSIMCILTILFQRVIVLLGQ